MQHPMQLNIAIVYGSVRHHRQGIKAARFVARKIEDRGHTVTIVDPLVHKIPMLDKMYKEYDPGTAPDAIETVGQIFSAADGFVVVSGEYNHSQPAALKNILDHYQSEYFYKPSAIVTYSAGPFGGVRALISLRAVMAELGAPSIPSAFPVSQVGKSIDDDGKAIDEAYNDRVVKFLDEFEWYCCALKRARDYEQIAQDQPMQQAMCRGK